MGIWKQLTSSILRVRAFQANTAHSPNVGLMSANVAYDVGLALKQHWADFSLEYDLVISSVADVNAVKVYSIGLCTPTPDRPMHAHFAVVLIFNIFIKQY